MAASFTLIRVSDTSAGRIRLITYDMRLDSSYPEGGFPILPRDVGLSFIFNVLCSARYSFGLGVPSQLTRYPQWNPDIGVFQIFFAPVGGGALEEIGAGANLANDVYRITILGI